MFLHGFVGKTVQKKCGPKMLNLVVVPCKIWLQKKRKVVLGLLRFNSIQFRHCTAHLVFQLVFPANLFHTVCNFSGFSKHGRLL